MLGVAAMNVFFHESLSYPSQSNSRNFLSAEIEDINGFFGFGITSPSAAMILRISVLSSVKKIQHYPHPPVRWSMAGKHGFQLPRK
jgi:hypothetical protein